MSPAASGQVDDDDAAFPADAVEVGCVLGAWGVRGQIRVLPYSTESETLITAQRWFILPPAPTRRVAAGTRASFPTHLQVSQARPHGDGVVATVRAISDRTAAEALKGARIFVARSRFPAVAEGEYYWIDLIGLAVVNRQGDQLGVVTDLLDTGAHSVLRVRRADQAADASASDSERLIPFVDAYVDEVRLHDRRILVDWGPDY